jgi:hypothetical protein
MYIGSILSEKNCERRKLGGEPTKPHTEEDTKLNTKKVRALSGLTQQQISHTLDMTLNGWQRKEQYNRDIKVKLDIGEDLMAELVQIAHQTRWSASELVSEMVKDNFALIRKAAKGKKR